MKRTPKEWCEITGIEVVDPDGWNRKSEHFTEIWETRPISFNEFYARAECSTCRKFRNREAVWADVIKRLMNGEIQGGLWQNDPSHFSGSNR